MQFYGCTGTVEKLIKELEADINAKNEQGQTALHLAALNGHTGTVEKLIKELEADINAKDKEGNTAFCLAARYGNIPIVGLLLPDDPNETINNDQRYTPLHFLSRLYKLKKDELIKTLEKNQKGQIYLDLLKEIESRIVVNGDIAEDSYCEDDITPQYLMEKAGQKYLIKSKNEDLQDLKDDLQEVLFGGITSTLPGEVGKVECNYENDEPSLVKIVITPEKDSSFKSMVRGTTSNQLKDKLKELVFEVNIDKKLEATVDINSMRDFINAYKTCCHLL